MSSKKLTIAIDGFSACGKSTLAKELAKKLHYSFIDSGAMYRAVTYFCMQQQLIENGEPNVPKINARLDEISLNFKNINGESRLFLNEEDVSEIIRTNEVAALVSKVAAIKEVRHKLVAEQRKMGENGGIIMDGRDIASVVFPNAELKLFVTASEDVRVERRFAELQSKGLEASLEEVRKNLSERDYLDTHRAESPLIQVSDAIILDNSNMTREEQLDFALRLVQEKLHSLV